MVEVRNGDSTESSIFNLRIMFAPHLAVLSLILIHTTRDKSVAKSMAIVGDSTEGYTHYSIA